MINAILRLRRDNDFNYEKIKSSFIPANGEICLIDTARNGLRAVCGDGKTVFADLPYFNETIQKGYYKDGAFYKDYALTEIIEGSETKIYIDQNSSSLYFYNGYSFKEISAQPPNASAEKAGVLRLYNEVGYNTDGTMTQKAITEELDTKVELSLKEEEELIIFSL